VNDLDKARTVPCPVSACKMPAGRACIDPDTGADSPGVHQARIYRAYVVDEAIAHNHAIELAAALERLRVAAEQYLDTEPRSGAYEAELRIALGDAAVGAALVLRPETSPDGER
jgi:hypothetical protein